jgi:hypothetical protein
MQGPISSIFPGQGLPYWGLMTREVNPGPEFQGKLHVNRSTLPHWPSWAETQMWPSPVLCVDFHADPQVREPSTIYEMPFQQEDIRKRHILRFAS